MLSTAVRGPPEQATVASTSGGARGRARAPAVGAACEDPLASDDDDEAAAIDADGAGVWNHAFCVVCDCFIDTDPAWSGDESDTPADIDDTTWEAAAVSQLQIHARILHHRRSSDARRRPPPPASRGQLYCSEHCRVLDEQRSTCLGEFMHYVQPAPLPSPSPRACSLGVHMAARTTGAPSEREPGASGSRRGDAEALRNHVPGWATTELRHSKAPPTPDRGPDLPGTSAAPDGGDLARRSHHWARSPPVAPVRMAGSAARSTLPGGSPFAPAQPTLSAGPSPAAYAPSPLAAAPLPSNAHVSQLPAVPAPVGVDPGLDLFAATPPRSIVFGASLPVSGTADAGSRERRPTPPPRLSSCPMQLLVTGMQRHAGPSVSITHQRAAPVWGAVSYLLRAKGVCDSPEQLREDGHSSDDSDRGQLQPPPPRAAMAAVPHAPRPKLAGGWTNLLGYRRAEPRAAQPSRSVAPSRDGSAPLPPSPRGGLPASQLAREKRASALGDLARTFSACELGERPAGRAGPQLSSSLGRRSAVGAPRASRRTPAGHHVLPPLLGLPQHHRRTQTGSSQGSSPPPVPDRAPSVDAGSLGTDIRAHSTTPTLESAAHSRSNIHLRSPHLWGAKLTPNPADTGLTTRASSARLTPSALIPPLPMPATSPRRSGLGWSALAPVQPQPVLRPWRTPRVFSGGGAGVDAGVPGDAPAGASVPMDAKPGPPRSFGHGIAPSRSYGHGKALPPASLPTLRSETWRSTAPATKAASAAAPAALPDGARGGDGPPPRTWSYDRLAGVKMYPILQLPHANIHDMYSDYWQGPTHAPPKTGGCAPARESPPDGAPAQDSSPECPTQRKSLFYFDG
ncbi:hypothetical protein MSPP1_003015 [Malassezia sp. CBS 17886]|nr:hypothetical protein MSPP1_003015 [Malassezia sp. CBS 17886]